MLTCEKADKIFNFYGEKVELKKAKEELLELALVLVKGEGADRVLDELSDVFICALHLKKIYQISDAQIQTRIDSKLDRTIERIERAKAGVPCDC